MSSRRALLTGGLASLLPFTVRVQSPSRARELLGPLLSGHHMPGASVALIRDGEIAELAAIGADPQTLFQAASISKVVTGDRPALGRTGSLGLERRSRDVRRGHCPAQERNRHATAAAQPSRRHQGVRLPRLCRRRPCRTARNPRRHTARQHVGGACLAAGGVVPLLRRRHDGAGAPRQRYRHGDSIKLARELVIAPVGMVRSRFSPPLPPTETNAASAHDPRQPLAGGSTSIPNRQPQGCGPRRRTSRAWRSRFGELALGWPGGAADGPEPATQVGNGPTGPGIFVQPRSAGDPISITTGSMPAFARCWCSPPTAATAWR